MIEGVRVLPGGVKTYLKSRIIPSSLLLLIMLGFLYQQLTGIVAKKVPITYSSVMIYALIVGFIVIFFRAPRWILYLLIVFVLVSQLFFYTRIISKSAQDKSSTRDEAVEMTAKALLQGKNPWSNVPDLEVPATTGPASILFALPAIVLFGEINWLTFLFWIVFYAFMLIGDFENQNGTFPILVMLFVVGMFEFTNTLFWSLDELYFAFLFLPLAYWMINRRKFFLTGALLAVILLFRLNYIFIVLGLLLWYCFNKEYSINTFFKMGIGAVTVTILVLIPFLIVGGKEFLASNPIKLAYSISGAVVWPPNNIFFRYLNIMAKILGAGYMRFVKLGIILGLMLMISLGLRRAQHPFWHIAAGAFLTQTIAWLPPNFPQDYELLIILPAVMAVAFSRPWEITGVPVSTA